MQDNASDTSGQMVRTNRLSDQLGHGQKGTVGDKTPSVRRRDGKDTWPPLKGGLCVRPTSGLSVREMKTSTEDDQ